MSDDYKRIAAELVILGAEHGGSIDARRGSSFLRLHVLF
jgi:hypothetical protein